MRGEKGFALVLTLVVTALMVAAAVELIYQVYVDISLNRSFRDGQQASILADSGVYGGIKLLNLSISGQGYTSLFDKWAVPFKQEDDTGRIEIAITEESGKINLNALVKADNSVNQATLAILEGLGAQLQIPNSVWNALADWIDTDDIPSAGGAETSYYKTLNPPYSARNGRMTTLNELALVKGFTTDMVAKLGPFVTVYANQGSSLVAQNVTVNVNTAPKEVLMALDPRITSSMAEQILEQRKLAPFKTVGDLSSRVNPLFTSIIGLTCQGTVFRIAARGFVKDAARTIEVVVRTDGSSSSILSWQEY